MPCLRHYGGMRVTPMAMLGNLPVLRREPQCVLENLCGFAFHGLILPARAPPKDHIDVKERTVFSRL
jgi:hypothetical protein